MIDFDYYGQEYLIITEYYCNSVKAKRKIDLQLSIN